MVAREEKFDDRKMCVKVDNIHTHLRDYYQLMQDAVDYRSHTHNFFLLLHDNNNNRFTEQFS